MVALQAGSQVDYTVKRVVVAMDSNDYTGAELRGTQVRLLGHQLRAAGPWRKTCAEGSNFEGVGDIIFDSSAERTVSCDVPPLPNGCTAMTDHLPVVVDTTVDFSA